MMKNKFSRRLSTAAGESATKDTPVSQKKKKYMSPLTLPAAQVPEDEIPFPRTPEVILEPETKHLFFIHITFQKALDESTHTDLLVEILESFSQTKERKKFFVPFNGCMSAAILKENISMDSVIQKLKETGDALGKDSPATVVIQLFFRENILDLSKINGDFDPQYFMYEGDVNNFPIASLEKMRFHIILPQKKSSVYLYPFPEKTAEKSPEKQPSSAYWSLGSPSRANPVPDMKQEVEESSPRLRKGR